MRKIVYSGALKLVAVLLFIVTVVSGVLVATNGIFYFDSQEDEIYAFEGDFSESWYIRSLLDTPESLIYGIYHDVYYEYDEWGNQIHKTDSDSEELRLEFEKRITDVFGEPNNFEKINYYVLWNGLEFTNCGAETAEDITQGEYFSYFMRDDKGNFDRMSSADGDMVRVPLLEDMDRFGNKTTFTISCSIKEEVVKEYKAIWEKQPVAFLSIISPLMYIVYPGSALGTESPFCYEIIQTFVYHGLLLSYGVLLITTQTVIPNIKNSYKSLIGIGITMVWAAFGNVVYSEEGWGKGFDWFFITGKTFPFIPQIMMPLVVAFCTFGMVIVIYGLYYLIDYIFKRRKAKVHT